MEKKTENRTCFLEILLLAGIILIQAIILYGIFHYLKQGYHSDEVFNYGFANSVDTKELNEDNDGVSRRNTWLDAQMFRDYLIVDKDHRFDYKSTLYNANHDLNPPLQILVLHTICSFFPDQFSWNFCLGLNLFCFAVTQIYLYLLCKRMTGNIYAGFAAVLLYGFGIGGMDIAIYMRLYAFGVMLMMMFMYYSHRVYEESRKNKLPVKELILMGIICFCGAYTLHIFLIAAFFITLCYVIYYLVRKRIKFFFLHGLACLIPVGISYLLDPGVLMQVGAGLAAEETSFASVKYPFLTQFRWYMYSVTKDLFGLHFLSYANVVGEVILVFLGAIIVFCIPIYFLIRKEERFRNFLGKCKNRFKEIGGKFKNFQLTYAVLFIAIMATIIIVSLRSSVYYMAEYSNRYIFVIYPLTVAWAVCTFYYVFYLLSSKKKVGYIAVLALSVIFAVWTHLVNHHRDYLFLHYEEGKTLKELEPDSNNILVLSEDWLLACFAPELMNTEKFYFTNFDGFKDGDVLKDANPSKPYYLVVDQRYILGGAATYKDVESSLFYRANKSRTYTEDDFLSFYRNLPNVEDVTYVGLDAIFGRDVRIYKLTIK